MGEGNVLGRIERGKENTSVLAFKNNRRQSRKTLLHVGGDDKPKFLIVVTEMGRGGGDLGLLGPCGKEVTKLATLRMEEMQKKKMPSHTSKIQGFMHSLVVSSDNICMILKLCCKSLRKNFAKVLHI